MEIEDLMKKAFRGQFTKQIATVDSGIPYPLIKKDEKKGDSTKRKREKYKMKAPPRNAMMEKAKANTGIQGLSIAGKKGKMQKITFGRRKNSDEFSD